MLTIDFNKETLLITEFLKKENVKLLEKTNLLTKVGFKKKEYANIYFHSGILDKNSKDKILNAKKVIVSSKHMKEDLLLQIKCEPSKIEVLYPAINEPKLKQKESKEQLCKEFSFDLKLKIILFTAKNLKLNGVKEFCDMVTALSYPKIKVVIAGDKTQISALKFQLTNYKFDNEVLFLEDYSNMSLVFNASDIFILPTKISGFSKNILVAMYHKTAVFVTSSSASREVVDVYSTMESSHDRSMPFKVDALLIQKEDLKLIKKQNYKTAKKFLLSKQLLKLEKISTNI